MPTTRVAVCQYAIDIDDPHGTLERLHASVAEAAESNPDVIVFPELCTSGYVFRDIAEAQSRAEPVDGPTVQLFRELSLKHHAIVVGGFCERSDGERPFNSAAVVENGEVLVVYRKTHLWDTEKLIFAAGDEPAPVVDDERRQDRGDDLLRRRVPRDGRQRRPPRRPARHRPLELAVEVTSRPASAPPR